MTSGDDKGALDIMELRVERDDGHYNLDNYSLCESVGYLLKRCYSMSHMAIEQELGPYELTHPQYSLLMILTEHDCSTAAELARIAVIDTGSVTRMIDRLETKGMVRRERSSTDRRIIHIRLTDQGKLIVKKMPVIAINVLNRYLAHFEPDELDRLKHLLRKLLSAEALLAEGNEAP